MKKRICILLALLLCAVSALAEEACLQGSRTGISGGDRFYVVDEGNTDALVRICDDGLFLSERANCLDNPVEWNGGMYYVRKLGNVWELVKRDGLKTESVYTFEGAHEVNCLTAMEQNFFVLIDSQLHILYPEQQLCLKLADTQMVSYVVYGDFAYYISVSGTKEYSMTSEDGQTVTAEEGCLYRLNLSTANTSPVLKDGVRDLSLRNGTLYFHNFGMAYLQQTESGWVMAGRLCGLDIESDEVVPLDNRYDWGYALRDDRLLVQRQEGIVEISDVGSETLLYEAAPTSEFAVSGDTVVIYDPVGTTFIVLTPGEDAVTVAP